MKNRAVVGPVMAALVIGVCACLDPAEGRVERSELVAEQSSSGRDTRIVEERVEKSEMASGRGGIGMSELQPVEVASILLVLNEAEVQHARLAQQRTSSDAVRSYAETMLRDHSSALERLKSGALARLGATRNDVTAGVLARQGQLLHRDLEGQAGESFDLTYITLQLDAHARLLGLIDNVFKPKEGQSHGEQHASRTGSERGGGEGGDPLAAELTKTREVAVAHLQRALEIHASIRRQLGPEGTHAQQPR